MLNRWKVEDNSEGSVLSPAAAPLPHSYWVTGVASLSPDCHPLFPEGLTICGARDNLIRLYDLQGNLVKCLHGHDKPPVSFSWTSDFRLVSGSWDGTARVWDLASGENTLTLGGHENAVNVLCLTENETPEPNLLATVSTGESVNSQPANFKLRVWSLTTGQQVMTPIEDHAGSIRSIFRIPGTGLATTSNDGSVQVRSSLSLKGGSGGGGGGGVSTFLHPPQAGGEGFPPFILGGCAVDLSLVTTDPLESTGFVSCGEDGSVVVWKGGEMEQVLPHPSSVWAVSSLPPPAVSPRGSPAEGWYGSDIATAGHDGVLRVFSCDPARTSKPLALAMQEALAAEVAEAAARMNKGPSSEEIENAPKWEARGGLPGTSESQVRSE
jgi:phospholipase A-2-activating protein